MAVAPKSFYGQTVGIATRENEVAKVFRKGRLPFIM